MSRIHDTGERLQRAGDLPAMLDAAYDAFEDMLSVIRAHEDPDDGMFTALVMAAGSVADGRDAILFSPSLPPHRPYAAADADEQDPPESMEGAVDTLAGLSGLLASRLEDVARVAADPGDQAACSNAARWARDVHGLLTGDGP